MVGTTMQSVIRPTANGSTETLAYQEKRKGCEVPLKPRSGQMSTPTFFARPTYGNPDIPPSTFSLGQHARGNADSPSGYQLNREKISRNEIDNTRPSGPHAVQPMQDISSSSRQSSNILVVPNKHILVDPRNHDGTDMNSIHPRSRTRCTRKEKKSGPSQAPVPINQSSCSTSAFSHPTILMDPPVLIYENSEGSSGMFDCTWLLDCHRKTIDSTGEYTNELSSSSEFEDDKTDDKDEEGTIFRNDNDISTNVIPIVFQGLADVNSRKPPSPRQPVTHDHSRAPYSSMPKQGSTKLCFMRQRHSDMDECCSKPHHDTITKAAQRKHGKDSFRVLPRIESKRAPQKFMKAENYSTVPNAKVLAHRRGAYIGVPLDIYDDTELGHSLRSPSSCPEFPTQCQSWRQCPPKTNSKQDMINLSSSLACLPSPKVSRLDRRNVLANHHGGHSDDLILQRASESTKTIKYKSSDSILKLCKFWDSQDLRSSKSCSSVRSNYYGYE